MYFQCKLIASFADTRLVILTDQNEGRKENCLQGYDQREKRKWIRVKMTQSRNNIDDNPSCKPNQMNPYKRKAAAKVSNNIRHLICLIAVRLGGLLKLHNRLHVLFCHFLYVARLMVTRASGIGSFAFRHWNLL